ncbi:NADP-dependent oxidoreductase [soil metagenome]
MTVTAVNRQWLLARYAPQSLQSDNFIFHEAPFVQRDLADGEILVRNRILSLGPSTRGRLTGFMQNRVLPPIAIGAPITSVAESIVLESAHPAFPVGATIWGMAAWEDYTYLHSDRALSFVLPRSLGTRAEPLHLNMLTAYFGLMKIGIPRAGETLVVSAAAGSVGFMAAQIGRANGCRVIGIAGGSAKTAMLIDKGKLDGAIDYRSEAVGERLKDLCPDGIDIYFDNVGDDLLDRIVDLMNVHGRIVISGQIAKYDARGHGVGLQNLSAVVANRLRLQGFVVFDHAAEFTEALLTLADWIDEGKIASNLDLRTGFDQLPASFIDLFNGGNRGALLVRIADAAGKPA